MSPSRPFRETSSTDAQGLTDGVRLCTAPLCEHNVVTGFKVEEPVILPWLGFGTYRLGKEHAKLATLQAVQAGYRSIDTAFIYGGESTEVLVGEAITQAIKNGTLGDRSEVFVTTKHWRKYHGYEPTLRCLDLSLKRLQLDYLDLWLMHWPGPAWNTMCRQKDKVEADAWHYAQISRQDMAAVRAETWRAMEDSYKQGRARAIGVSNMTIQHLQTLKLTATLWPPAVNQIELHPLRPQSALLEYCRKEGIIVQAYASLGGQDMFKKAWLQLIGGKSKPPAPLKQKRSPFDLMHSEPVAKLAKRLKVTPAQVLLRYGLEKGCVIIPKTTSKDRLVENSAIFGFQIPAEDMEGLEADLLQLVKDSNPDHHDNVEKITRLTWRSDPFRLLEFE